MRILLSNDDGYFAPCIDHLARALADLGEITVVAPERDRSGISNSLTLDRPLSLRRTANGFYHVNRTPTDCVQKSRRHRNARHAAGHGRFGINHGANMGDDTIYSGTVAAATEGYLLGVPAIAMSLVGKSGTHFATAAHVAHQLVQRYLANPVKEPMLLNVNVPDIPLAELKGIKVTRLGAGYKAEPVVKATTPRGETVLGRCRWRGGRCGRGDRFPRGGEQHASVTPLQIDLTHSAQLALIQGLDEVGPWQRHTSASA